MALSAFSLFFPRLLAFQVFPGGEIARFARIARAAEYDHEVVRVLFKTAFVGFGERVRRYDDLFQHGVVRKAAAPDLRHVSAEHYALYVPAEREILLIDLRQTVAERGGAHIFHIAEREAAYAFDAVGQDVIADVRIDGERDRRLSVRGEQRFADRLVIFRFAVETDAPDPRRIEQEIPRDLAHGGGQHDLLRVHKE